MSTAAALPLFLAGLVVALAAAGTFARRLDRLGARFGLSEVSIGLLTALAADGPELSSALVALIKGSHDAGVGVIVGSNTFNLAAMLGVSALLAGAVRVPRVTLIVEGTGALVATALVIALLLGWLPVAAVVPSIAAVVTPYLVLVIGGDQLAARLGLGRLAVRARDRGSHPSRRGHHPTFTTHRQLALMVVDVLLIVAGSFAMVQSALSLGTRWGVSTAVVGALVLGPATSVPNALTGIRLGIARRGSALVTETLNSNTINLVAGVALPAIFVPLTARRSADRLDLALLAASMLAAVALLAARGGMKRSGAAAMIALYAAFVAVTVA